MIFLNSLIKTAPICWWTPWLSLIAECDLTHVDSRSPINDLRLHPYLLGSELVGGRSICVPGISVIVLVQIMATLLSILTCLGRQQKMAQVCRSLSAMKETWMELLALFWSVCGSWGHMREWTRKSMMASDIPELYLGLMWVTGAQVPGSSSTAFPGQ